MRCSAVSLVGGGDHSIHLSPGGPVLPQPARKPWPGLAHWYRICLPMLEMWLQSRGGENPRDEEMGTHSKILEIGRAHV